MNKSNRVGQCITKSVGEETYRCYIPKTLPPSMREELLLIAQFGTIPL